MIHISAKRPVKVIPGLELQFPGRTCCNCGTSAEVQVVSQDTRVTRFLLGGGTEITFQLPLPFCKACEKSSKRRPAGLLHRSLVLAVSFAACALALLLVGDMVLSSPFVAEHLGLLAGLCALAITVAILVLQRPATGQTSYFQPVRIIKLRQEFVSGTIKGMRLRFTNPQYAAEFSQLNAVPLGKKLVEVSGI